MISRLQAEVFFGFLLRHHANRLVQIGYNLLIAIDKTAVNTADGIFIRLPATPQLVEFFLVHWFYQTFRYDIWLVALWQFRYMFGFSPYLTFRTSIMPVFEHHFFYDRRPTSSQENSK